LEKIRKADVLEDSKTKYTTKSTQKTNKDSKKAREKHRGKESQTARQDMFRTTKTPLEATPEEEEVVPRLGRGGGGGREVGMKGLGGRGERGGRGGLNASNDGSSGRSQQGDKQQGQKPMTQQRIVERSSLKTRSMISKLHSLRAQKGQEKRDVKKSALVNNMRHEKTVTKKVKQELVDKVNKEFWKENYGKPLVIDMETEYEGKNIISMESQKESQATMEPKTAETHSFDEMYDDPVEDDGNTEGTKNTEKEGTTTSKWSKLQGLSDEEDELYVEDREKKSDTSGTEQGAKISKRKLDSIQQPTSNWSSPYKPKTTHGSRKQEVYEVTEENKEEWPSINDIFKDDGDTTMENTEDVKPVEETKEKEEAIGKEVKRDKKISFAQVAGSKQTVIRTHEVLTSGLGHRFEIRFEVKENMQNATRENEAAVLQEVLENILKRGKRIDSKMSINTWRDGVDWPIIKKKQDIPEEYELIKLFINHPLIGRQVHQKFNNGWRVRIVLSEGMEWEEFIHHWERSKNIKPAGYVGLKDIPLQKENYHTAGYFLNSGDQQEKDQLQRLLSEEMETDIGLSFKPAALDKMTSDHFWKEAKKKAQGEKGSIFRYAPMAMQVTAETKKKAHEVCMKLHKKYGYQQEGQYPKLPDGTRMKFVPASIYLDHKSNLTARGHFKNHIAMNAKAVQIPIPIRDPTMMIIINEGKENEHKKSIGSIILDLECEEKHNEPYFRHFAKKWSPRYEDKKFTACVHNEMIKEATGILEVLEDKLINKYGEQVRDAFTDEQEDYRTPNNPYLAPKNTGMNIILQTEDRYGEGGKGQFIITGMENVGKTDNTDPTLEEIKQGEKETRSLGVISNFSNLSNTTGKTGLSTPAAPFDVPFNSDIELPLLSPSSKADSRDSTADAEEKIGGNQSNASSNSDTETEQGWQSVGSPQAAHKLATEIANKSVKPLDEKGKTYP
jgi:hypothetical protein